MCGSICEHLSLTPSKTFHITLIHFLLIKISVVVRQLTVKLPLHIACVLEWHNIHTMIVEWTMLDNYLAAITSSYISLFVYIFHFLDYAPGGGKINVQLQSLVSLLPFVPTLKDSVTL